MKQSLNMDKNVLDSHHHQYGTASQDQLAYYACDQTQRGSQVKHRDEVFASVSCASSYRGMNNQLSNSSSGNKPC